MYIQKHIYIILYLHYIYIYTPVYGSIVRWMIPKVSAPSFRFFQLSLGSTKVMWMNSATWLKVGEISPENGQKYGEFKGFSPQK